MSDNQKKVESLIPHSLSGLRVIRPVRIVRPDRGIADILDASANFYELTPASNDEASS